MHEIFHIIGLCPDSLTHLDLSDIFIVYYSEKVWYFETLYLSLRNKINQLWQLSVTTAATFFNGLLK